MFHSTALTAVHSPVTSCHCSLALVRGSSKVASTTCLPHTARLPNLPLSPSGGTCNLPTIPSASDFNTVLSSDQNTLDGTLSQHSQHSTSQDDMVDIEEGNQCPAAVQLADAQVLPTHNTVLCALCILSKRSLTQVTQCLESLYLC